MAASSPVSPVPASRNSITILNLPDELLVAIFTFLGRQDQLPLQLVCHRLLYVARDPGLWTCIVVRLPCKTRWPLTKEAAFLAAVRRATMLRSLQCINVLIQDINVLFSAIATSCPSIEKLCVPHHTVARMNVELLVEKCPNLADLYLNIRMPHDCDSIKQLKNLRSLRVRGWHWGYGISFGQDILLEQLAKRCVHLKELHIDNAGVGADTFAFIATEMAQRMTGLTVKISYSPEKFMHALDQFSALQDLTLKIHPDIHKVCFGLCTNLKNLKRLKIECEGVYAGALHDFFSASTFKQLRTLKLKKARYFDYAVLNVVGSKFAELEELHIDGSFYIDDGSIDYFLIRASCLKVIKLSNLPDVTSDCLDCRCEGLSHLKVKLCDRISKEDVKSIARQTPGLSAMVL